MTIRHRSLIWVTQLGASRAFEVRTVEGFAAQYGGDPAALVASNLNEGRPLADTVQIGFDPYDAALELQRRGGLQVSFGDVVEIEGRKYEVRHRPGGPAWDEVELVLQEEPPLSEP
jgi:hypothetical protein